MRLSALFQDGMVLQRNEKNYLWGYTTPQLQVEGDFSEKKFTTTAGETGYFEVELPMQPVGGPYKLRIIADEVAIIKNIMVGDVFLLGGQSNMELPISRTLELYRDEIHATVEPDIRMFEVAKEYEFGGEREDVFSGKWQVAVGEELLSFSAAGYFAAKALKERIGVPIGLIQSAVGGTPAKAWCSEKTIRQMGLYTAELDQCKEEGYPKRIEQEELAREQRWHCEANEAFGKTALKTGTVHVPELWRHGHELRDFCGAIRLRRQFELSAVDGECEVALGAMVDADKVYINGTYIGETEYCYPPRFYQIPAGVLRSGHNEIEIRLRVCRGQGGFMPGKPYGIRKKYSDMLLLDLAGMWNYEIMEVMEELPYNTFFNWKAAALYNGMLAPISKWNISAVLYYQGESNVDVYKSYEAEMRALIADWRTLWQKPELPFIYVQLAGFSDGETDKQGRGWALLRAEQEKLLAVPQTAMVVAYDVGDYSDLHPFDKKTVGERLALAVRKLVYEEDIIASGAKAEQAWWDNDDMIHISFTSVGSGLCVREGEAVVGGIELVDENGNTQKAQAMIQTLGGERNLLQISVPKDFSPIRVCYAWWDYPFEANLYNGEGLPMLPFYFNRIEKKYEGQDGKKNI
ncbi:sialate O-acetylesterase [Anaerosporobacter sp.]|uniref:sialate O-acetylesterase n=1 Tax=Anaerosporobacter sp. TaxID=1872529 RepID=UPI00286F5C48|nr:sialate O-acetylesterase [Anaerosporobacter sp.]